MSQPPAWTQALFFRPPGEQVSHGLNLALPLDKTASLPRLLWDIAAAQPVIRQALADLDFVHFARFVPSWDGTALMVTTSFDGPLAPYVQDFVIPLGEVFDRLLSYVDRSLEPAPPRSVRAEPEAFLAFVQAWNRVPLGRVPPVRFPAGFDFPMFSAYPDKTVADILGPRRHVPQPSLDAPDVLVHDPRAQPPLGPLDLADVQGHILSGYRVRVACHCFFAVTDGGRARRWLGGVLPDPAPGWPGITPATPWAGGRRPLVMAQVGLTAEALARLLPERHDDLRHLPEAFREGALARAERNHDHGDSAPAHWLFGNAARPVHVVVTVYEQAGGDDPAAAGRAYAEARAWLREQAPAHGLQAQWELEAAARPGGREAFGFHDGISPARISGLCQPQRPDDHQPAASPGEFVLGENLASRFGGPSLGPALAPVADLLRHGSFAAVRLLEQDVEAFEQDIAREAARRSTTPERLEAKLMGRWKASGAPVSLHPDAPPARPPVPPRNDFDHAPSWEFPDVPDDHDGLRCPVGAHIRRTNPRHARVAGQRHSRRLLRRGLPATWTGADGRPRQGLMGWFIGASLEHQFEFVQREWIHGDRAASGIRGEHDPIAGQRSQPADFAIPGLGTVTLRPFVRTRGSLYLLLPGLAALRSLAAPAAARSAAQAAARALVERAATRLRDLAQAVPQSIELLPMQVATQGLPGLELTELPRLLERLFERPEGLRHTPAGITRVDAAVLDPLDPRFVANPYPVLNRLRDAHRLVHVPAHEAVWVLDRELALELLGRPADFVQQPGDPMLRGILTADGSEHQALRGAVADAFAPAMRSLPAALDEACTEALRSLDGRCEFDLVAHYGHRVTREVFWRLFAGTRLDARKAAEVDAHALRQMQVFSQPQPHDGGNHVARLDAALGMGVVLAPMLACTVMASALPGFRPACIVDELADRVVLGLPRPRRTLAPLSALMTLMQIVLAGLSSRFLLGSAALKLLQAEPRPGQPHARPWDALQPAPALADVERAVHEARRVEPPVTMIERFVAAQGATLAGVALPPGAKVCAVVAAVNRQAPAALAPDQFHVTRPPGQIPSLSLGHGVHACVGDALQQAIVPEALRRLMVAMPELRLARPDAVPPWVDNVVFRDLRGLSVTRCPP